MSAAAATWKLQKNIVGEKDFALTRSGHEAVNELVQRVRGHINKGLREVVRQKSLCEADDLMARLGGAANFGPPRSPYARLYPMITQTYDDAMKELMQGLLEIYNTRGYTSNAGFGKHPKNLDPSPKERQRRAQ